MLTTLLWLSTRHAVYLWNLMPRWSLTGQDFVFTEHLTLLTFPSVDVHRSPRFFYVQTHHINQTRPSLNTGYCLQFFIMYFPRRQIIVAVNCSLKCSQSLMESAFVVVSNTERGDLNFGLAHLLCGVTEMLVSCQCKSCTLFLLLFGRFLFVL